MSVIDVIPQYILLFYEINTLGEVSVGKVDYNCVENSIKICNQQKKNENFLSISPWYWKKKAKILGLKTKWNIF